LAVVFDGHLIVGVQASAWIRAPVREDQTGRSAHPPTDAGVFAENRNQIECANCGECRDQADKTNAWGVFVCLAHRSEILGRLNQGASTQAGSGVDGVAAIGCLSTEMPLG